MTRSLSRPAAGSSRAVAGLPICVASVAEYGHLMSSTEVRQRGLALGLGAGLTVSALWGAAVVLIVVGSAAHVPDRLAVDGDPCCPIPDDWADVTVWSVTGVLLAAIDAAVLAGGLACLYFGLSHRSPSRRIALVAPAAAAVSGGAIVLAHVAQALA